MGSVFYSDRAMMEIIGIQSRSHHTKMDDFHHLGRAAAFSFLLIFFIVCPRFYSWYFLATLGILSICIMKKTNLSESGTQTLC